ncbi:MAG: FecR domain-containing protein [Oscillospiraceae bacterium]|nr:FecR domain-containing protein [Oscillospiraceae bacterium]
MNSFIQKVKEHAAAIVISAIVLIVLILAVIVFVLASSGNSDRRLIIEDITGSAFILKTDGQVSADKKMQVESGDVLITAADSTVRLSVDKDKSVYIEPETTLYIYYTEAADKGSIVVNISEGGAVCRLDSKLGKNEIFQVKTPNAVISAAGTVFRTEFNYYDSYGNYTSAKVTDVDCVEGNVDIQLYDNTAAPAEPLMMLTEGKSARLLTAAEAVRYEFLNSEIRLDLLKENAIKTFIRIAAERKICFSLGELNDAYQVYLNGGAVSEQETTLFDFDEFTQTSAVTTAFPVISDTETETSPVIPSEISSDITDTEYTGLPPEVTEESSEIITTTVPEEVTQSVISVTSPTTVIYTVSGNTGTTGQSTVTTASDTAVQTTDTAAPAVTQPPQTSAAVTADTTVSDTIPPIAPASTAATTESETVTESETTKVTTVTKPTETTVPWWEIINSAALTRDSEN